MLDQLKAWTGTVEYNGQVFDTFEAFSKAFKVTGEPMHIKLLPAGYKGQNEAGNVQKQVDINKVQQYKVFVKQYMTKPATPKFDFMEKWHNNNPMPYRIMVGEKVKETRGMVYMKLHADITERQSIYCMCCGRQLTNKVSQYFGIGPECGNHNYINPFNSEEELQEAVAGYREKLRSVTWEGWIIKSAIMEEEEV